MAIYYLDSSALVKRYIAETGSNWVLNLLASAAGYTIFIAAIAPVEITAAIMARARGRSISIEDAKAACQWLHLHMQKVKEQQPARLKLAEVKAALDLD